MNQENAMGFMVPRADLKPETFDTLITQKGYKVIWEQGMFCSCYSSDSGQPDYSCPACKGKGYVYFSPKETRAIVTSINGRKEQEHIGLNEVGGAYLTPLSTDNVGFRDRFTFLDFTMKFSQLLLRGAPGDPDILRYPANDITCLRLLNEVYKRGIDFDLSHDGKQITWLKQVMDEGTQYSVLYDTQAVYIAINPIHELRGTYTMYKAGGMEQFVKLPKQFQIKREDFLDDSTTIQR
jgi:hypothetical protein